MPAYFRFQSTLPREERPSLLSLKSFSRLKFQSTLPREERLSSLSEMLRFLYFNPRSHERSDFLFALNSVISFQFQSTLPREERQALTKDVSPLALISIHAPTRGATLYMLAQNHCFTISIHAPTRGATL